MGRGGALVLAAYPLAVHYGAMQGEYLPALLLLGAISVMLAVGATRTALQRIVALLALASAWGALGLLWRQPADALLLPPLLIFLFLAAVFGTTLLPGRQPLVTRIAIALGDAMDAALARYTRAVTLAWTVFFLALAGISLGLALAAPRLYWSWFTNFVSYGLILLFFAVEFALRRQRFPRLHQRGFGGFLRALLRLDPRGLRR